MNSLFKQLFISIIIVSTLSVTIAPYGSPTAGDTYVLNCSISGRNYGAIYSFLWLKGPRKNRIEITSDSSRTIASNSFFSLLQFLPLKPSHTGLYACQTTVDSAEPLKITAVQKVAVQLNTSCEYIATLMILIYA